MIPTAVARGRTLACAVFALLLLALPAAPAGAADADLDPSFGSGGLTRTTLFGEERLRDVAVAPDGKVVGVGRTGSAFVNPRTDAIGVVRLNADGSPDTSFGTDGKMRIPLGDGSVAEAVTVQPDGKIVVAGWQEAGGESTLRVVRIAADGKNLDPGFGSGGVAKIADGNFPTRAYDVMITAAGKIAVAGAMQDNQPPIRNGMFLVLFTADGTAESPQASLFSTTNTNHWDGARSITPGPAGDFYLTGTLRRTDPGDDSVALDRPQMATARVRADGSFDGSWGDGQGIVGYNFPALQDTDSRGTSGAWVGGKFYGVGFTEGSASEILLTRWNGSGSRDGSFGTGGQRTHGVAGRDIEPGDVAAVPGDKLLVAAGMDDADTDERMLLARFDAAGGLDGSFGSGGTTSATIGDAWPYAEPNIQDGARLHEVGLAMQPDGKAVVGGTTFGTGSPGGGSGNGSLWAYGIGRFGATGGTPDAGGGGSGITPPAPSGGGSQPTGPGGTGNVIPLQLVDTTRRAKMPDLRGLSLQKAIASVDRKFFADVTVRYTNEKSGKANEIGEVASQKPAPGAEVASGAGDAESITLTIYEGPKPVGRSRCPEAQLKEKLKGLGPYYAELVARQLKCRIEVQVDPAPAAKEESVSKVTAKDNKVVLTVKQPVKPERNELYLAFQGVRPQKTNTTFNADDWSIPVGPLSSFGVTVISRSGDLVKNANLTIDGTDVGGRDYSRMSGADGRGLAYLTVQPKKTGQVTVTARGEVGGQVVTGVGVINVRDLDTFTTVNGDRIQLDGRNAVQKVTDASVQSAGISELWGQLLAAIGLGTPAAQQVAQTGRTPEQNLSAAAKAKKAYPVQVSLGQPLGGDKGNAQILNRPVGVAASGRVTKAPAPVIEMKKGNFIGAASSGLIGQAGGNLIGTAGGNVQDREIDLKKAQIISDNGLGLISDNGLGLISENGLGLISDNGLGLIAPQGLLPARSVTGIIAQNNANIVSTYGGG